MIQNKLPVQYEINYITIDTRLVVLVTVTRLDIS
jgi:hypothetical protein